MKIILTGGGTAGHVTPNIALLPKLKEHGYEISYIGTKDGMEYDLITREKVFYHAISAGKLRRYFDMKNLRDMFSIIKGFFQALSIIKKEKPDVIFSKGGFVSCPVVWAGWLLRIPVIIHESDITPGLANRLSLPFARKVCVSFPETVGYLKKSKCALTGIPIRESLLKGKVETGIGLCGFDNKKPVILVIGGSLGSAFINQLIRNSLEELLGNYNICHICGKNSIDNNLVNVKGYKQFDYINDELAHVFAIADIVVSRAGATTLFEILALEKPSLLIPLSKRASRGDQILNAKSFEKKGLAKFIEEENINKELFLESVNDVFDNRIGYKTKIKESGMSKGIDNVLNIIFEKGL